ncbi:MAG: GntR family transcriptional regulator [Propionibacteriaceae bacterium]|jgi:DNA-binding transcriptional regulator YhcF (GntR family)|nr:GntR family transcriptional regulator [Propionibacteriaceae bacterium]
MIVRLDAADPTPPYEQVRRQLATAVAVGELAPGTRLPTVRQLAGDLGVATGTVMRAYAELESAGILVTARGAGTRVAPAPPGGTPAPDDRLAVAARTYVATARTLGASQDQTLEAVVQALR